MPELIIPAGKANNPMPRKAIIALKILPRGVMGYISPYPTVVKTHKNLLLDPPCINKVFTMVLAPVNDAFAKKDEL